jgi:Flp pilus assembly CpaF family ATPase
MIQPADDSRSFALLHRALGVEVLTLRKDPTVVDILVRPWGISVDRLGAGLTPTGIVPAPGSIDMVIRTVRSLVGGTVTEDDPTVEAEMPDDGSRFAGQLAGAGSFYTIRCHRSNGARLEDYQRSGGTEAGFIRALCELLDQRKRVVINGPTGSGKTHLLRACMRYAAGVHPQRHFVVIEDTPELAVDFDAPHRTFMHTTRALSMRDLSRSAMRHRPDFLVYGEIRGAEALDVRNYSISGHTTYFTIHAYGAISALNRFAGCIGEAVSVVDYDRIVEAVDAVVTAGRRVEKTDELDAQGKAVMRDVFFIKELVRVDGYAGNRWQVTSLMEGS